MEQLFFHLIREIPLSEKEMPTVYLCMKVGTWIRIPTTKLDPKNGKRVLYKFLSFLTLSKKNDIAQRRVICMVIRCLKIILIKRKGSRKKVPPL